MIRLLGPVEAQRPSAAPPALATPARARDHRRSASGWPLRRGRRRARPRGRRPGLGARPMPHPGRAGGGSPRRGGGAGGPHVVDGRARAGIASAAHAAAAASSSGRSALAASRWAGGSDRSATPRARSDGPGVLGRARRADGRGGRRGSAGSRSSSSAWAASCSVKKGWPAARVDARRPGRGDGSGRSRASCSAVSSPVRGPRSKHRGRRDSAGPERTSRCTTAAVAVVLRPPGADDRDRGRALEELLEQVEGRGVGPVQVLQEDGQRTRASRAAASTAHSGCEQVLARRTRRSGRAGGHPARGGAGTRDPSDVRRAGRRCASSNHRPPSTSWIIRAARRRRA